MLNIFDYVALPISKCNSKYNFKVQKLHFWGLWL